MSKSNVVNFENSEGKILGGGIILQVFECIEGKLDREVSLPQLSVSHYAWGDGENMVGAEVEVASLACPSKQGSVMLVPILLDCLVYLPEVSVRSNRLHYYSLRRQFFKAMNAGLSELDYQKLIVDPEWVRIKASRRLFLNYDRDEVLASKPEF
jgi:hypothetical protein